MHSGDCEKVIVVQLNLLAAEITFKLLRSIASYCHQKVHLFLERQNSAFRLWSVLRVKDSSFLSRSSRLCALRCRGAGWIRH